MPLLVLKDPAGAARRSPFSRLPLRARRRPVLEQVDHLRPGLQEGARQRDLEPVADGVPQANGQIAAEPRAPEAGTRSISSRAIFRFGR